MHRTTIAISDVLALRLEREAERRKASISAITREALEAYFEPAQPEGRRITFAAVGASGKTGIARNAERELDRAWSPDRDR